VQAGKYWVVKTYLQDDKSRVDFSLNIEWNGNLFTDGGDINFSDAVFTITQNSEYIQEKTVLGAEFAGELTLNTKQTFVVFFNAQTSEVVPTGHYSVVRMYAQNDKSQITNGGFDIEWNGISVTSGDTSIDYALFTFTENSQYNQEKAELQAQFAGEITFPDTNYKTHKFIIFFNAKDSAPVGVGPPGENEKAPGVGLLGGGMTAGMQRSTGALGAASTNAEDGISDKEIDIIVFVVAIFLAFIVVCIVLLSF